jgi:hypothetical protein
MSLSQVINFIDPDFLDDPDDELECAVCFGVMVDPVSGLCGHSLCRGCFSESLDRDKRCPVCRLCVENHQLVPNRTTKNLIAKKTIRCEHVECGWTGCVEKLPLHRSECAWMAVRCPFEDCAETPLRKDLQEHEVVCGTRQVKCICSTEMPRSSLAEHETLCAEAGTICPFCQTRILKKDFGSHVTGLHAQEAANAWHAAFKNNKRVAAVESEARFALHPTSDSEAPTVWAFNWEIGSDWSRGCFKSEIHDFGGGVEGRFFLMNQAVFEEGVWIADDSEDPEEVFDDEIPHVISFELTGENRDSLYKIHATFSILDPCDKPFFQVEFGTANTPLDMHGVEGIRFELTADQKAQSMREDGSARVRTVVHLLIDGAA